MADTLTTQSATPATIPANSVIATDDAGAAGHVQVVKLAVSTDGSATALTANNTDGLLVNLGSNNDVTVTGSVTANAGTNLNTSALALESGGNLAAAVTSLALLDNAVAGNEFQVDIVSSALPTGAATLTEQQTQTTSLQLIDDAIYTDGSGTPSKAIAIAGTDGTNPQIIKTDASGELQVDILSMPTVTVTDGSGSLTVDGTVTANLAPGTNNIGDVDIFSNTVKDGSGTRYQPLVDTDGHLQIDVLSGGGGGTQYTEADTDASITGTAIMWEDGSDTLRSVSAAKPLPVNIISGAGSGGTAIQDDTAFTVGTTNLTPVGGTYKGTLDSVDDGDAGAFAMTAKRALHSYLVDANGDAVSVGGGTQYTEDAAAAANPVGNALILVREDARAGSLTNTDGDNVAARGNNKGELYVKTTDSDALLTTIAGAVSGSEMQVDIVSSALPTGASTLAEQQSQTNHLATIAGDTTDIETAIELIDDAIVADDAAFTPATTKVMMAGFEFDDNTPDSVNEGDGGAARMSANRNIYTNIRDAAGNERGANVNASNQLSVSVDNTVTVGSHAVTNAGTFPVQVDGSALTALQIIDNPVIVDDAAFTPATSSVMMAGYEADESSIDSVDEGDAGAARMTLDRKVIVTPQPHTAGGLSTFMASGSDGSTALTSTAQAVKASAGQLYGYYIYNPNAIAQFAHFYNTAAASVTVGTTNPLFTLTIPPASAANLSMTMGIEFSNAGWSISATATAGGNGAPTTALDAVVWYK